LLQLTLYLVPTPFELQFCHSDNCFGCGDKTGCPPMQTTPHAEQLPGANSFW
jgi:hypothetical protein